MQNDFFTDDSDFGAIKLEITVDDFMKAMENVARETTNSLLAKMDEEQPPEFILRKEAMKLLNVPSMRTMIRWEETGYLTPYTSISQIYYRKDEVVAAIEKYSRKEVSFV